MKLLNDEIYFDGRKPDSLFSPDKPLYADVLDRWEAGDKLTPKERKTALVILILNPEYMVRSGRQEDIIQFIKRSLKIRHYNNPETGLYYYSLFYLLIKSDRKKEALKLIPDIKYLLEKYKDFGIETIKKIESDKYFTPVYSPEPVIVPKPEDNISRAYIQIISRIMDAKELLELSSDFNLNSLPLPVLDYPEEKLINLRFNAFTLYENKLYKEALDTYNLLRISRFYIFSTLLHFARIQMLLDNSDKVETYIEMASRHQENTPVYTVLRLLWFRLYFSMQKKSDKKDRLAIVSEMKKMMIAEYEKTKSDNIVPDKIRWEMRPNLEYLKDKLSEDELRFLTALIDAINYPFFVTKMDEFEDWKEAE